MRHNYAAVQSEKAVSAYFTSKQILQIVIAWQWSPTRWPDAGLMLAHRLRRWANIRPSSGQHVVFTGDEYEQDEYYLL